MWLTSGPSKSLTRSYGGPGEGRRSSMPEPSSVSGLIDAVREQRTEDEPLYITASRVFQGGVDDLGDEQMTALEVVGFESVRRNGPPSVISVPSVIRMVEQGKPYDHEEISPKDRPKLMLLGFLALSAETFLHEDDG
jgi:hypothetical protein